MPAARHDVGVKVAEPPNADSSVRGRGAAPKGLGSQPMQELHGWARPNALGTFHFFFTAARRWLGRLRTVFALRSVTRVRAERSLKMRAL